MFVMGTVLPTGDLTLHSDVLGLDRRLAGDTLQCYDPTTSHTFLTYEEAEQSRQEAARRQAAEARLQAVQATRPSAPPPAQDTP